MNEKLLNILEYTKKNKDVKILSMFAKGNIFVYAIVYIQAVIINSKLDPINLGKYSYYLSLLTVILSTTSLSIYGAHLRFLGFVDKEKLMKFIKMVLIFATIIYLSVVLIIWKNWYYVPLVALIWFNEELFYFRSSTKVKLYTGMKFTQHIIIIIIFYILLLMGDVDYNILILITGIAYFLTYLVFKPFQVKLDIDYVAEDDFSRKEVLKYSLPGAISALSIYFLASADQIFINSYLTMIDLSNYAMALRMIAIIQLFTAVFMDYWPRFYFEKANMKSYKEINSMGLLFKTAILIFSIVCIIVASPIYFMMGARAYVGQSTIIFSVLVFSEIFRVFGSINMTYRSYTKESVYNVSILAILGVFKIGINFLFIEQYGLIVLLATTLISYILYWLISIFVSVKAEKKYMQS